MMKKMLKMLLIRHKNKNNLRLGRGSDIALKSSFEGRNYIGNDSTFNGSMGFASYIGDHAELCAKIGKFTCIAGEVKTINGFHPTKDFVSIHPAFYEGNNMWIMRIKLMYLLAMMCGLAMEHVYWQV